MDSTLKYVDLQTLIECGLKHLSLYYWSKSKLRPEIGTYVYFVVQSNFVLPS